MIYLAEIRKALVPVGVSVMMSLLAIFGLREDMTLLEAVTYSVTAILVYLIPNKRLED